MKRERKKLNKKRNVALVYECLIREMALSVIKKDTNKQEKIVNILKKHFNKSSSLNKELELYKALYNTTETDKETATKLLNEAKRVWLGFGDENDHYNKQTELINDVNKELDKSVYMNFVPNYRNLATIYQILNKKTPIKKRVVLENKLINSMTTKKDKKEQLKHISNLTYKSFIERFNREYKDRLLKEQKELLTKYISSFNDNEIEFMVYLNEEVGRIKSKVISFLNEQQKREDRDEKIIEKTKSVLETVESFKKEPINEASLKRVLKLQQLVSEFNKI